MRKAIAAAAATFFLAAPVAAQDSGGMMAGVLVVESLADFESWLTRPASPGPYPRQVRELGAGRQVHFPIVVTRLRPPAQGEMKLVADMEFLGPDGKSIWVARQCCAFTITNRPDVRTAVLGPTANLRLEPGDLKGEYTVRVSVSDGSRTAVASERFRYVGDAAPPPGGRASAPEPAKPARPSPATESAAAPKLRMDSPARNPGRDQDKRDCLALPTPQEVIKCAERK